MDVPAGTTYADLTVIREVERSGSNRRFLCRCTCGKESVKFLGNLRLGRSTSCGCNTKSGEAGRAASVSARRRRAQITDDGRICHTCGEWKRWSCFSADNRSGRGKSSNCIDCSHWRAIRAVYGVSRKEWMHLLDSQGGGCALCQSSGPSKRRLAVDHDHDCCGSKRACKQCVRGLLCDGCNRLLGLVERRPALRHRFDDYLSRRPLADF